MTLLHCDSLDIHSFLLQLHFFDLRTGGCLLAVPARGVAVLAHTLKQDHYERQ